MFRTFTDFWKKYGTIAKIVLPLLIPVVLSFLLLKVFPIADYFTNIAVIQRKIADFGVLGPLVYIVLQVATVPLVPVPSVILATASGVSFGFLLGTLYSCIAWLIGTSINYWLARVRGRPLLIKLLNKTELAKVDVFTDGLNTKTIFISWFIPAGTADLVGYSCGLFKLPFRKYLKSVIPAAVLLSLITAGSGALMTVTPVFTIAFSVIAIGGVFAFPYIYKTFWGLVRRAN